MPTTEEVYEFMFSEQLKERKPLTPEDMEKMTGETFIKRPHDIGQNVLFFGIESHMGKNDNGMDQIHVSIESMDHPKDLPIIVSQFNFLRMMGDNIPLFKKRKE